MAVNIIIEYLRAYRRPILLLVIMQFMQVSCALSTPAVNAHLIDRGVVTGNTRVVIGAGGALLALALAQLALGILTVVIGVRIVTAFGHDLRKAVHRRIQSLPARLPDDLGAATLLSRTVTDVQQVQTLAGILLMAMTPALMISVVGVVLTYSLDAVLATIALTAVLVLGWPATLLSRRAEPYARRIQERFDDINRILREQLTGVRVIRAFDQARHERSRLMAANQDLMDDSIRLSRLSFLASPMSALTVNVFGVAILWSGGFRVSLGDLQIGELIAFLSYLAQLLAAVTVGSYLVMAMPRAEVSARRIEEIMTAGPGLVVSSAPVRLRRSATGFELRGVTFRYAGAADPVLTDVDFVSYPGTTTALIGSTGSGKSTLLGMVPRLFDPTAGAVLIDGVDVRDVAVEDLRKTVGLVSQRPRLFDATVAENLRFADPDASDRDLWHALEVAQARTFVEQLPGGLHTSIGPAGATLSGGQRQRLAIARTLLLRPRIYLFDESFSALDPLTETAVRSAIATEIPEATVVLVAQRISSVRSADRIVVLDGGHVAGAGTHDDLLADNPVYRQFDLLQGAGEATS